MKRREEAEFAPGALGQDQREHDSEFEEHVFGIKRCTKVVKGGRKLSFSAIVVVGDHNGRVGFGLGKANEISEAIRKGGELARRSLYTVKVQGETIPHEVNGKFSGSKVLLRPAVSGTGVIAAGGVRAILNLAGIRNVLSKSLRSRKPLNVVNATFAAIKQLRTKE